MAENIELNVIVKGGDSVGKAAEKVTSLRTQLKEMKAQLASGQLSTEEFNKLSAKAGELQDRIGDVNQRVKNLASDTKLLDGFASVTQGIAGGFAAAQGAAALWGGENEDLQKTLVKVQGSVALLNGLQAVFNTLNKTSAATTLIQTTYTNLLTAAKKRYAAAVGTATGAMKLFRIAGAALGIGLIVAAIGLLISKFEAIRNAVTKFLPSLDTLGKFFTKIANAVTDFIGITSDATRALDKFRAAQEASFRAQENDIELMKARGATAKEVYDAESKLIADRIALLAKTRQVEGKLNKEQAKEYAALVQEKTILDATYNKSVADANKKAADERNKAAKEQREKTAKEQADAQKEAAKKIREEELEASKEYWENYGNEQADWEKKNGIKKIDIAKTNSESLKKVSQDELRAIDAAEQQRVELTRGGLQAVSDLVSGFAGKSEQAQRTAFAVNKAANIAQTIIDTITSAQGAYKSQLSIPTPDAPIRANIAAGIAIAQGLSRVAAIKNTQFGSSSVGNTSGGGNQPQSNTPNIRGFQTNLPERQTGGQGNIKVFVTETDITQSIRKVGSIYNQATVD